MRFNVIELPGRVKLPARFCCSIIFIPPDAVFLINNEELKRLSNHFFAFLPQRLGRCGINRITAHSFTYSSGQLVRHDMSHVAVLAIFASDLVSGSNDSGPHGSCRTLGNCLPLEGTFALSRTLLIDLVDHISYAARILVTAQFGLNTTRVYGGRARAVVPVPFVEREG